MRQLNVSFPGVSLLACHRLASQAPGRRRSRRKSGRRDSNPRQPAWKAGTHKNNARLLSNGSIDPCRISRYELSTPEAGFSCLKRQAYSQFSFQSYRLPLEKASFIGKMFYEYVVYRRHLPHYALLLTRSIVFSPASSCLTTAASLSLAPDYTPPLFESDERVTYAISIRNPPLKEMLFFC